MPTTRATAQPCERQGIDDFHPLEMIPWFRRWPQSLARDLVYTLIWSVGIGLLFYAMAAMFRRDGHAVHNLVSNVLVAVVIGYTMHAIFLVTGRSGLDRWARGVGPLFTAAYYTVLSTIGVFAGFVVVALAFDMSALTWILQPRWIATMGLASAIISSAIAFVFFSREREARAESARQREQARLERAEREAALANLRALQAQIEPHFLFNTLANVTSLVDANPSQAKRMLESFNRFLRASLAATRTERTTLAAERELIASYLDVLQVRMGERLAYRVDLEGDIGGYELPAMLLQPIVENAIQHGLEPKVAGGEIVVSARREAGIVRVEIADTGVGFAPTTRGGLGLTNVRDRLRLIYGAAASLSIAANTPEGTRVVVSLPA